MPKAHAGQILYDPGSVPDEIWVMDEDNNILQAEAFEQAKVDQQEQLQDLLNKTYRPNKIPAWVFWSELPENVHGQDTCAPAINYLKRLKAEWRRDQIDIPIGWKATPADKRASAEVDEHRLDMLDKCRVEPWLILLEGHITYISPHEVQEHHKNLDYTGPDYLLSEMLKLYRPPLDPEAQSLNLLHTVANLLDYDGEERTAEFVIPAMLSATPRCRLYCQPSFNFDPLLQAELGVEVPEESIDFAHILLSARPFRKPKVWDKYSRVILSRPALLVGAKGPARWVSKRIHHEGKAKQHEKLENVQRDMSIAVYSSLTAHILNWKFCHASEDLTGRSLEDLPAHIMVLGVIYDAEWIRVVAHFSRMTASKELVYISVVVDTIPCSYKAPRTSEGALDRLRVATALLVLRRHAFRLASEWEFEDSHWYRNVIGMEDIMEKRIIKETRDIDENTDEEESDDNNSDDDF